MAHANSAIAVSFAMSVIAALVDGVAAEFRAHNLTRRGDEMPANRARRFGRLRNVVRARREPEELLRRFEGSFYVGERSCILSRERAAGSSPVGPA